MYPKKKIIDQLVYFARLHGMKRIDAVKAIDYWLDRKRVHPESQSADRGQAPLQAVVKEEIEKGKIVLFSSHQMNYIEEFCDSIAILNKGNIVLQGNIYEIKHNYVRDKLIVRSEEADAIVKDLGSCCRKRSAQELLIQMAGAEEKQNMMKRLTEAYDIDEIKIFEPSLNDIFVEYAGDQD